MTLIFSTGAAADQDEAAEWYEQESQILAQRFQTHLETTLQRIAESPRIFPFIDKKRQKALLQVFPYAVIFERRENSIWILAVAHAKRRPGYWRKRTPPHPPASDVL